ncbi:hypothetical protein [Streptomyces endophytica]|uniref:Uncharacterized protein n=1 Tax=Streptomyces endophytica TaxID=2991496 RepID=A0ABY6PL37_9ACTN|nr:hypothetical protein [Streptomyces endophytica]UZJ34265.1 hypothetical protein OJ254_02095 [Streptomyces endophytica]
MAVLRAVVVRAERAAHPLEPQGELDLQGLRGFLPVRPRSSVIRSRRRETVLGWTCSASAAYVGLPPASKYASRVCTSWVNRCAS